MARLTVSNQLPAAVDANRESIARSVAGLYSTPEQAYDTILCTYSPLTPEHTRVKVFKYWHRHAVYVSNRPDN